MPNLMTGPQHLEKAAELAATSASHTNPDLANARATAALAHAQIAQALAWAALVAGDVTEPELAAPWLDLVDPTGKARAAMREAEARREAERRELAARLAAAPAAAPSPYDSAYVTPSPYSAPAASPYGALGEAVAPHV